MISQIVLFLLCLSSAVSCQGASKLDKSAARKTSSERVKKPTNSEGSKKVQSYLMVSRNGVPSLVVMDLHFGAVRPSCEIYQYDAEVYLIDQDRPLYKESKTIKLVRRDCQPCLPPPPPLEDSCDPVYLCRATNIYPLTATLNFDVMPYFKSKTELIVKFKNFKGIRKLNDILPHKTGLEDVASQNQKELARCTNEIQDAELKLTNSDLQILISK